MVFHSRRTLAMFCYLEIILDVHPVCVLGDGSARASETVSSLRGKWAWRKTEKTERVHSGRKSEGELSSLSFSHVSQSFMTCSSEPWTPVTHNRNTSIIISRWIGRNTSRQSVRQSVETCFFFALTALIVQFIQKCCPGITEHKLTQPFQGMLSLVFGPRPDWQELCAALDIPLAPALSQECDCQAVSIVEVAACLLA